MQAINDRGPGNDAAPGAIEAAATTAGEAPRFDQSVAALLRLGGRKADLVAVRMRDGDFVGAADYLRAAADYIEIATALSLDTNLAAAA
jgi:hypothetical protein